MCIYVRVCTCILMLDRMMRRVILLSEAELRSLSKFLFMRYCRNAVWIVLAARRDTNGPPYFLSSISTYQAAPSHTGNQSEHRGQRDLILENQSRDRKQALCRNILVRNDINNNNEAHGKLIRVEIECCGRNNNIHSIVRYTGIQYCIHYSNMFYKFICFYVFEAVRSLYLLVLEVCRELIAVR